MNEKRGVEIRALAIKEIIPTALLEAPDASYPVAHLAQKIETTAKTTVEPQPDLPVVIPVTLPETLLMSPLETVPVETENLAVISPPRSHPVSQSHDLSHQKENLLIHCLKSH